MNALEIRTFYSALATLLVTFTFSYAYKIQKKPSSFSKCLASGIILSALIFHIIPEIYESETAPLYCAFSFIFLFAIDKIYLEGEEMPKDISIKKAICFVFLLSLHSFFEGLGCCLRESLTSYLIGLLGHKWAEAFVFGVSIRNVFNSRITFGLICLYSILTPVGMLIGLVFKNCEKLVGIMDGLSGGSFFYIGFVEMLNSEFVDNKNVRRKTLAVVYGFCLMSVMFYIMNEIEKRNQ